MSRCSAPSRGDRGNPQRFDRLSPLIQYLLSSIKVTKKSMTYATLREALCDFFLHTMPHLFPPAVSIVVKMSSPHCRMQKEGGILMRLPCV